jgi:hypothetical protein
MVELRGGLVLREEAVLLALALEDAGHRISTSDGKLTVSNGSALTPAQRAQIADCRAHLMALAAYQPPEPR